MAKYREIDDGQFFPHRVALLKLKAPQRPLVEKLVELLGLTPDEDVESLFEAEKLTELPELAEAETPEEIEEVLPDPPNMKDLAPPKAKIPVE